MRPETGPMEFEGDWAGVFIRGDNALYYGQMLQAMAQAFEAYMDPITKGAITGLADTMMSANHHDKTVPHLKLKRFAECLRSAPPAAEKASNS